MPEWLSDAASVPAAIPATTIAVRLLIALALGGAVAAAYRVSHGRQSRRFRVLAATLVLLTVLLAMVTMVIGDSLARAFGLVGALSIVRFRTVVKDTRDTAFVIFAVIVGMAAGAGLVLVPLIGIPIVTAAAVALSNGRPVVGPAGAAAAAGDGGADTSQRLTVRVALGRDPAAVLDPPLARRTRAHRLIGVATAKQGSAIEVTYAVTLPAPEEAAALVLELHGVEGVQSVELRER